MAGLGPQILSFTSVSIAENKRKFNVLFCTLSKNFHLGICKKAALHAKNPDFGCNMVVLSDLHLISQVLNCLTAHDAETKLVSDLLSLVEKPKDHPSRRSDNLFRGRKIIR